MIPYRIRGFGKWRAWSVLFHPYLPDTFHGNNLAILVVGPWRKELLVHKMEQLVKRGLQPGLCKRHWKDKRNRPSKLARVFDELVSKGPLVTKWGVSNKVVFPINRRRNGAPLKEVLRKDSTREPQGGRIYVVSKDPRVSPLERDKERTAASTGFNYHTVTVDRYMLEERCHRS